MLRDRSQNGPVEFRVLPDGTAERGLDIAGRDRVDLNARLRQFCGQNLGEHQHRGFADTVDAHARLRPFAGDGGHVDDFAAAPFQHLVAARFGHAKVADHVHIEDLVPVALLGGENRAEVGVCGRIVDQDVDASECVNRLLHQRGDGAAVAGMGGNGEGAPAICSDRLGHLVQPILFAAAQHDCRPHRCVAAGDRRAYAPGGAGDHRDFAGQIETGELAQEFSPVVVRRTGCCILGSEIAISIASGRVADNPLGVGWRHPEPMRGGR